MDKSKPKEFIELLQIYSQLKEIYTVQRQKEGFNESTIVDFSILHEDFYKAGYNICEKYNLQETKGSLETLNQISNQGRPNNVTMYISGLSSFIENLKVNLNERNFFFLVSCENEYYESKFLTNPIVKNNSELKLAGEAIAFNLDDAAVFYAMRETETTLKNLIKKISLNNIFNKKIKYDSDDNWGDLEDKLNTFMSITNNNSTPSEKDVSDLRLALRALRKGYRNPVMHSNDVHYSQPEAKNILSHAIDVIIEAENLKQLV